MALPLFNSFEGGSNGTPLTVANSGGASGNGFDAVTATVPNFSTTQVGHGLLSAAIQTSGNVAWSTSITGTNLTLWGRFYVLFTSAPNVITSIPRFFSPTSAATACGIIQLAITGKVSLIAKSGTTITSATTLSTSTLYRVEFKHTLVVSGTCTMNATIYLGDSTTPLETMTQATGTGVSTDTAITTVKWGSVNATTANIVFFDDIQINNQGFPGPYLRSLPTRGVVGMGQAVNMAGTY